ncbi:MAG TPA: alpha/beta fold hydrolase [Terriglobia bacterium]|nr:alpha/beta fold hydrolase [Terriglobia bacterium]
MIQDVDPKVSPFKADLEPPVRGFLHRPSAVPEATKPLTADHRQPTTELHQAVVLTHGAGSNCQAPLLAALASAFAAGGFTVLRCDLPYRQKRPHGPPVGSAAEDRQGLRNAVAAVREMASDRPLRRIYLGGHSYGGRQATMLAADDAVLVDGLLLLSYPLHPPRKPEQLRTAHFPKLRTPAMFVHGSRDPFGSLEEMESALKLIPAATILMPVEGASHDLSFKPLRPSRPSAPLEEGGRHVAVDDLPAKVVAAFCQWTASLG